MPTRSNAIHKLLSTLSGGGTCLQHTSVKKGTRYCKLGEFEEKKVTLNHLAVVFFVGIYRDPWD